MGLKDPQGYMDHTLSTAVLQDTLGIYKLFKIPEW